MQNDRRFADGTFKCIFLRANVYFDSNFTVLLLRVQLVIVVLIG